MPPFILYNLTSRSVITKICRVLKIMYKSATQQKVNRSSAAGNKKITMSISKGLNNSNAAWVNKEY